MMHMSGLEKRRIDRFYFVAVAGVLYCSYTVYACGVDAMLGSAVAVTSAFAFYMIRKGGLHVVHNNSNKVSIN